ncbi:MAG: hypothetical protein K2H01_03010 [Ruminococcus sp.]|nr:hypothetical protein [Ruminococcus sp.]
MKKLRKILSAAITAALAVSSFQISSFSASAKACLGAGNIFINDDFGFEIVDDKGAFSNYVSNRMEGFTDEYTVVFAKKTCNPNIPEYRGFEFYTLN